MKGGRGRGVEGHERGEGGGEDSLQGDISCSHHICLSQLCRFPDSTELFKD